MNVTSYSGSKNSTRHFKRHQKRPIIYASSSSKIITRNGSTWCISIDWPATIFSAEHPCCWTTRSLLKNCQPPSLPLKMSWIGEGLLSSCWLALKEFMFGDWHSWGYKEYDQLTRRVRAEADWYCLPWGWFWRNICSAANGIWAGSAGVMVEATERKQW